MELSCSSAFEFYVPIVPADLLGTKSRASGHAGGERQSGPIIGEITEEIECPHGNGREGLGFPLEPGDTLGIRSQRLRQDFDGYLAIEGRVSGPIHLPHPALADLGGDLIRAEAGAGSEGQTARSIAVRVARTRSLLCNGVVFTDAQDLAPRKSPSSGKAAITRSYR